MTLKRGLEIALLATDVLSAPSPPYLLVFLVDGGRYALPLSMVDRVIRAVDVTPLPTAPAIIHGVINVHGRLVPVVNIRKRFGLGTHEINIEDCFLLASTARHTFALVVDAAVGVIQHTPSERVATTGILAGVEMFPGFLGLDDGLVLIQDLEKCLSPDETRELDQALQNPPAS